MVEPGIFHPVKSAHLSAGAMFAELSLEPSALAGEIAIIETTPRARQAIAQSSARFLVCFNVSSRRFSPAPSYTDALCLLHRNADSTMKSRTATAAAREAFSTMRMLPAGQGISDYKKFREAVSL
jgi:hypothetical protein